MDPVEHERPGAAGDAVRIWFAPPQSGADEVEVLWGRWTSSGIARVENIPLLAFGVSRGDEVRVGHDGDVLRFAGVERRGGHSTYRVMLSDSSPTPGCETALDSLASMGCGFERMTQRFIAIDIPPQADIFAAYEVLDQGMSDGCWTFEEAFCGHPIDADQPNE